MLQHSQLVASITKRVYYNLSHYRPTSSSKGALRALAAWKYCFSLGTRTWMCAHIDKANFGTFQALQLTESEMNSVLLDDIESQLVLWSLQSEMEPASATRMWMCTRMHKANVGTS